MPSIPDTGDVSSVGKDSVVDGLIWGLGTNIGRGMAGAIGEGAGGVVAGASIGGQKGETLATISVERAMTGTLLGGGGGGRSRGVK